MFKIILKALAVALRSRRQLVLENVALRHQLEVLQCNIKRPRLRPSDRALWALLSRILPDWRRHLSIVQPDTVVRWHRAGWRLYWRWKSNPGRGRPKVSAEVRTLTRRLSREYRLWGAPRIHGELLKLGYDLCETTIAKPLRFQLPEWARGGGLVRPEMVLGEKSIWSKVDSPHRSMPSCEKFHLPYLKIGYSLGGK